MPGHLLLTIPISHYCEKARWALDRARVPYREERHVQGVHIIHAARAARSRTLPILLTADGTRLTDSAAIVRWCDGGLAEPDRLLPTGAAGEEAATLEAGYDAGLGVEARLWMYHSTLPVIDRMLPALLDGTPRWERHTVGIGRRVFDPFVRRYLGVSDASATRAAARVEVTFDQVAERLADGRPFLCGERFTAADLTFAALSAAVLAPPDYGSRMPPLGDFPVAMRDTIERRRAHPAGAFAMRLYADERRRRV